MKNIIGIFLAGALLIAPTASIAAESKSKPRPAKSAKKAKSRTLKELIAYAEKHGYDKQLGQTRADDLGFAERFGAKKLMYVLSKRPHAHERALWVVFEGTVPIALIWDDFRRDVNGESLADELWTYRSSLTGKIERCAHGVGNEEGVSEKPVEVDNQVKKSFADLVSFFLVDAIKLEPKK